MYEVCARMGASGLHVWCSAGPCVDSLQLVATTRGTNVTILGVPELRRPVRRASCTIDTAGQVKLPRACLAVRPS
jgi:hypothetical protein